MLRILHVEVGGSYGGSVRALALYLENCDSRDATHDVLLYYPTTGLGALAAQARTLFDRVPARFESQPRPSRRRTAIAAARKLIPSGMAHEVASWVSLAWTLPTARRIYSLLRQGRYDLVHVNNSFSYQVPTLLAAKQAAIPVVAYVRNPVRQSPFSRRMMRLAQVIVSDSQFHASQLNSWGLPVQVTPCYNGVELPQPDAAAAAVLRSTLLAGGDILIGSVGRLDPQKGYEDLIRAARILVDACPGARFAIAGEGPLRPSLETLIAELGLTGHFHLCGFRSDVADFLAALDLYVCSSHWEGLPLSIVEAMLLGKPVVATDVGGNSEVVVASQTGELVPAGVPGQLAATLLAALKRPEELRQRAEYARQRAAESFDPRANARQLDGILRSVLESGDGRRRGG